MSFAHPWVLLLVPLAIVLMRRRHGSRPVTVASTAAWPLREGGRERWLWLPVLLRNLAIVLVLLAMARPQAGSSFDVQVTEGIAIELLVDVSSSMDMSVTGFDGENSSRMEVAKDIVERFIAGDGDQLSGRPDDLIGLITFARYADTRSPLTFGHDALLQIVRNIEIQDRPNEDGTAYGDAIAVAAARLKKLEELRVGNSAIDVDDIKSRVVVVLTDGENNSGSHLPLEAAGMAKEWGCRIYAISLGDSASTLASEEGAYLELSPAEKVLERISVETGGLFRKANDYESLMKIYAEIDRLERSGISTQSVDQIAEWFWLPLALGIGALTLALIMEATVLRVTP